MHPHLLSDWGKSLPGVCFRPKIGLCRPRCSFSRPITIGFLFLSFLSLNSFPSLFPLCFFLITFLAVAGHLVTGRCHLLHLPLYSLSNVYKGLLQLILSYSYKFKGLCKYYVILILSFL